MRKFIIILFFYFATILLFAFSLQSFSKQSIVIDGNIIDNNFNNCIADSGRLVRQKNTLYYYFQPNGEHLQNGLYKISKEKTERIYTPNFSVKDSPILNMQSFREKIFLGAINSIEYELVNKTSINDIIGIDFSNNSFYCSVCFDNFNDEIEYYYSIDREIFFATDSFLYCYSNGKYMKLLNVSEIYDYESYNNNPGFNGWYLANDQIYFFSATNGSFCSYNLADSTKKELFTKSFILSKTKANTIDELNTIFFVSKNNLILLTSDTDDFNNRIKHQYYVLNIDNQNVDLVAENISENSFSVNFYNNVMYYGSDVSGLRAYSLEGKKEKCLSCMCVSRIYIIDDKYVYFNDNNQSLYRITIDGKTIKKVY